MNVAKALHQAITSRSEIEPFSKKGVVIGTDEAYDLQDELVALLDSPVVGYKLGLVSKAKQIQMKVSEPVYGTLTAAMEVAPEDPVPFAELIHPRCEPELVFRIGDDIDATEHPVTASEALAATAAVTGGIEIIDSRYQAFAFTHTDVIADNTSAARYVLGTRWAHPAEVDLGLLGMILEVDGEVVASAAGASLAGHPAQALALAANHLGRRGQILPAGAVVLAGGMTDAVPLKPGMSVAATYASLGSVTVRVPR